MKYLLISTLILLAYLLPSTVVAHDLEVDGIYYNVISSDEVEVTYRGNEYGDPDSYSGEVVLPATVLYNGTIYAVTGIGFRAFDGCTGMTNVIIPNSVIYIGYQAFEDCTGLMSITIPNSVAEINDYAFSGCSALTDLDIGNSVSLIGEYVFSGCTGLTSITIASDNPIFDSRNNCNAIIETVSNTLIVGCQNTIIPNSVTSIGDLAFYGCTTLTAIDIPYSITSIGWRAFQGCSRLAGITIPNSVTQINEYAFSGCSALTCINLPNSITCIGDYAFYGCTRLDDVYSYITDLSQLSMGHQVFFFSNMGTLHVPVGTATAYQADGRWSQYFGAIVEIVPGDVDSDGTVCIHDVTALIDHLLNGHDSISNASADVDGDGTVSIHDVTALVNLLLGGH